MLNRAKGLVSPREIVRSGLCIGCGSCVAQAQPQDGSARMVFDRYGQLKPEGPSAWMRERSIAFSRTCPFSPLAEDETQLAQQLFAQAPASDARVGRWLAAYVGHVAEAGFREAASSGGLTSWVAAELLNKGFVDGVVHVAPADATQGRFFAYRISRSTDELRSGAKSRYYPVELSGVLAAIRATPGRYAVVGIPCFIKAVQLLRRHDPLIAERIAFTLGLFCGHMKSARMVESFAWQMGVDLKAVKALDYRAKNPERPASWYTMRFVLRDGRSVDRDWFHLAEGDWGSGFFQNSACNFCDDVVAETADISFGDAWVEPYAQDGRGTNVVVVRSPLLHELLGEGIASRRLQLTTVDAEFVARTQAAGLRQRREGLAYRLTWARLGVQPRKRVPPDAHCLATKRKSIYRIRAAISAWSARVYFAASVLGARRLYMAWAGAALAVYHGVAYARGKLGKLLRRLGRAFSSDEVGPA